MIIKAAKRVENGWLCDKLTHRRIRAFARFRAPAAPAFLFFAAFSCVFVFHVKRKSHAIIKLYLCSVRHSV